MPLSVERASCLFCASTSTRTCEDAIIRFKQKLLVVLVDEDQLSLAAGEFGVFDRLASELPLSVFFAIVVLRLHSVDV